MCQRSSLNKATGLVVILVLFDLQFLQISLRFCSRRVLLEKELWKVKLGTGAMARLQPLERHANHERDGEHPGLSLNGGSNCSDVATAQYSTLALRAKKSTGIHLYRAALLVEGFLPPVRTVLRNVFHKARRPGSTCSREP
ncbi:hypothetical protein KC335_g140 [Hortaea werneckii]|nr:hypothetical protein KC335_g140 [Hortaea werneckii]